MSDQLDQATRARLRECYTQAEPPPCPVCGEARIKRFDQTADRRWECWAPDPPGIDMRDHIARGIWLEPTPDIDVIAALNALDRAERERDAAQQETRVERELRKLAQQALINHQAGHDPEDQFFNAVLTVREQEHRDALVKVEQERDAARALIAAREYLLRDAP